MEKISGILPASSRVTSVDLAASQPKRPGAASFGAPTGSDVLGKGDRFSKSSVEIPQLDSFKPMTWKDRDTQKAGIVEKMTDDFFRTRLEKGKEIEASAVPGPSEIYSLAEVPEPAPAPVAPTGYLSTSLEPVQQDTGSNVDYYA